MNNLLRTVEDYELFLYSITEQFPAVKRSTVTFVRRGISLARVVGELYFDQDFRIVVRERILSHRLPVIMDWYGYEVWRGEEKLFWYDPQPHPNDPELQSTHPHHKHVPPDIKRNRVPAPEMYFDRPNLPKIIREVELLIEEIESQISDSDST